MTTVIGTFQNNSYGLILHSPYMYNLILFFLLIIGNLIITNLNKLKMNANIHDGLILKLTSIKNKIIKTNHVKGTANKGTQAARCSSGDNTPIYTNVIS